MAISWSTAGQAAYEEHKKSLPHTYKYPLHVIGVNPRTVPLERAAAATLFVVPYFLFHEKHIILTNIDCFITRLRDSNRVRRNNKKPVVIIQRPQQRTIR